MNSQLNKITLILLYSLVVIGLTQAGWVTASNSLVTSDHPLLLTISLIIATAIMPISLGWALSQVWKHL